MRIIFLLSHAIFKSSPFVGPCRCQSINKICTRRRNKCCGHILSLHIFFSFYLPSCNDDIRQKKKKKRNKKSYDHILIFLDGSHPVNRYTDYEAAFFNDIHTILFSSLACLFVCLRLRQQVWWVYATFAHLKRAIWLLFN